MSRFFITGSSDGLGLRLAKELVSRGHTVYLHARNAQRAAVARKACPDAADVLIGDFTSIEETKALAASVSKLGKLDCIFHNAGLYVGPYRAQAQGYPAVFAVNVLAPYILTCLAPLPKRLIYTTSIVSKGGECNLDDFGFRERNKAGKFDANLAYNDTKLFVIMLCYAFARKFASKGVVAHAVHPGWVPTKISPEAPGDLLEADKVYLMLAEATGEAANKNACYWEYGSSVPTRSKDISYDEKTQEIVLKKLEEITGVSVPV
ncbi:short chain dehydrogenase [Xylaria nigripes]|nr:short chain dehydrogenase [Xylaria nigripes]